MAHWFGPSWDAPVCDPATHRPTPVGLLCPECCGLIKEDDQGMLIPYYDKTLAWHRGCFMENVLGPNWRDEN